MIDITTWYATWYILKLILQMCPKSFQIQIHLLFSVKSEHGYIVTFDRSGFQTLNFPLWLVISLFHHFAFEGLFHVAWPGISTLRGVGSGQSPEPPEWGLDSRRSSASSPVTSPSHYSSQGLLSVKGIQLISKINPCSVDGMKHTRSDQNI